MVPPIETDKLSVAAVLLGPTIDMDLIFGLVMVNTRVAGVSSQLAVRSTSVPRMVPLTAVISPLTASTVITLVSLLSSDALAVMAAVLLSV